MSHLIQKWPKNKANFLRHGKAVRPALERSEATPPLRKTKPIGRLVSPEANPPAPSLRSQGKL